MAMAIKAGDDVVSFLKGQHQQVKSMLAEVLDTEGAERTHAFEALCDMLDMHEAAEEQVVHPAAKEKIAGGRKIVAARLREEASAKKAIKELKALDIDSDAFVNKFQTLQQNVLAHAEAEEQEEFEVLGRTLEADQLKAMRKEVEAAEAMLRSQASGSMDLLGASREVRRANPSPKS